MTASCLVILRLMIKECVYRLQKCFRSDLRVPYSSEKDYLDVPSLCIDQVKVLSFGHTDPYIYAYIHGRIPSGKSPS